MREFLTAALLHDVGKGIDANDHVLSGVQALEGYASERTLWLIEHHMEGSSPARSDDRRPCTPSLGIARVF